MAGFPLTALVLALACPLACAAETIDFEGIAAGTAITTIGNATFSSPDGVIVYDFGGDFAHSGVNVIGGGAPDFFSAPITVDFATAVMDLSFFSAGDDNAGLQAQINVWVGGAFAALVNLAGDGNPFTVDFQDLSAFSNVTRIEIFNVTDDQGLAYDDFSFTKVASVPLPATALLLGAALLGLGRTGRRKTRQHS